MVELAAEAPYSTQLQNHLRLILESSVKSVSHDGFRGLINEIIELKYRAFGQKEEVAEYHICNLLEILTACISSIHQVRHAELISEVYSISLWECQQDLRQAVLGFLLHLAVVSPTTTQQTLQFLVLGLQLPFALARQWGTTDKDMEWAPSDLVIAVHRDVVSTIAKMLELIPISGALLTPILARGVPNKFIVKPVQCTYLYGLFSIAELPMAGAIKQSILTTVVQHLLSLDVEILWQDIAWSPEDEAEEEDEEHGKGGASDQEPDMFELEGGTEEVELDPSKFQDERPDAADLQQGDIAEQRVSGRGGFEGEANDSQPSTSGRPEVDDHADKLDCMMCLVFRHLETRITRGEFKQTWKALLDVFFLSILNTHRSKFTQYLLWIFLMKEPEYASTALLKRLMSVLSDPRQADITRSAAAAYIASYLARSAFVPSEVLVEAIQKLAGWCMQFCEGHSKSHAANGGLVGHQGVSASPVPQSVVYQVFYAACQALLYVLCYRLEQLMHSADGSRSSHADAMSALFRKTMPNLLNSRLTPLAVCLPTVVQEFSRLSVRLGLLDSRILPEIPDSRRCNRALEMFFPYDPYLLRLSSKFLDLQHTFVRWKGGKAETAEKATHDSDTEDEEAMDASSESESSGLDSHDEDSDGETSQLADEFQDLTPRDTVTVERMGMMINGHRRPSINLAASHSSAGTGSPTAPMSWTPKLPDAFVNRTQTLLRPLDVQD